MQLHLFVRAINYEYSVYSPSNNYSARKVIYKGFVEKLALPFVNNVALFVNIVK